MAHQAHLLWHYIINLIDLSKFYIFFFVEGKKAELVNNEATNNALTF